MGGHHRAVPSGPFGPGEKATTIVSSYAGHAGATATAAGWFSVVLIGRVLFMIGLRWSLHGHPELRPVLDFATVAMAAGVVLEIAVYGIASGAARVAADGGPSNVVVGLDGIAYWLNLLIFGPTGVAVLLAGLAMLRSRAFPGWLCWLPVVSGALGVASGILIGLASDHAGVLDSLSSIAVAGMWVWMVATGIVLWRRPRVLAGELAG